MCCAHDGHSYHYIESGLISVHSMAWHQLMVVLPWIEGVVVNHEALMYSSLCNIYNGRYINGCRIYHETLPAALQVLCRVGHAKVANDARFVSVSPQVILPTRFMIYLHWSIIKLVSINEYQSKQVDIWNVFTDNHSISKPKQKVTKSRPVPLLFSASKNMSIIGPGK